jgi:hypothetical protein
MIPDFHDGLLEGLCVFGSEAKIFLKTFKEQKFTLTRGGVERLHAENFWEGNIILSLGFLTLEQLTVEDISEAYHFNGEVPPDFVMKDWIESAKQRNLQAMEISSSYGCTALAFFKSHDLREGYVL